MPKASMDGTQIPMNMAAVVSPLKYNTSEKISERKAEINNNLSVVVNLLNIVELVFRFFMICVNMLLITPKESICLSFPFPIN
jgi:hypothetical protein